MLKSGSSRQHWASGEAGSWLTRHLSAMSFLGWLALLGVSRPAHEAPPILLI